MGEKRENREIEVRYSRPLPESWRQLPAEVVLEYRAPEPEVALTYSRPLPEGLGGNRRASDGLGTGKRERGSDRLEIKEVAIPGRVELECWNAPPWETGKKKTPAQDDTFAQEWKLNRKQPRKRRRGLWIFAACITVLVGLTAAAGLLGSFRSISDGDFSYRGREYDWHWDDKDIPEEITIPRWPTGQGASLAVKREHGTET